MILVVIIPSIGYMILVVLCSWWAGSCEWCYRCLWLTLMD